MTLWKNINNSILVRKHINTVKRIKINIAEFDCERSQKIENMVFAKRMSVVFRNNFSNLNNKNIQMTLQSIVLTAIIYLAYLISWVFPLMSVSIRVRQCLCVFVCLFVRSWGSYFSNDFKELYIRRSVFERGRVSENTCEIETNIKFKKLFRKKYTIWPFVNRFESLAHAAP